LDLWKGYANPLAKSNQYKRSEAGVGSFLRGSSKAEKGCV
jgi:hypothetical protein